MIRQERRRIERNLREFKVLPSSERLTASTGVGLMVELIYKSPFFAELEKCVPERVSHRSLGGGFLALSLVAGHLMGLESVEDLEEIRDDEFLMSLFDGDVPAPRTVLDFLNDFESSHIEKLNILLNTMGKVFHSILFEEHGKQVSQDRILDLDSTYHVHHGDLFEGVSWNYKNQWSLESQSAFSALGFCHQIWLRPGNTKSGTDADVMIRNLFDDSKSQVMRKLQGLDFVRMDSAFCNQDTIKSCMEKGLFFTITANKATTLWHLELESQGVDWRDWHYSEKELKQFEKSGTLPPTIQLGRIWWVPSWGDGKLRFPIIVKRTWKTYCKLNERSRQGCLFAADTVENAGEWEHHAVVCNFDLTQWTYQEIMLHHQKRASSENMNKEMKYGFRLNNLPCRSLSANRAWCGFAMFAHNIMRLMSLMNDPQAPCMSKKTRRKFINFPAKVLERSKRLWLRVPQQFYMGVIKLLEGWRFPERMFAHILSTA